MTHYLKNDSLPSSPWSALGGGDLRKRGHRLEQDDGASDADRTATPAPLTTRPAAIVQAAVFDAVNGTDRVYAPIHVEAAAAYATLVVLSPAQKATSTSGGVPRSRRFPASHRARVAQSGRILEYSDAEHGGTAPGEWRPTPPANAAGLAPRVVRPCRSSSRLRLNSVRTGPPLLNSET